MANKKDTPKADHEPGFDSGGVDPELESKVDAMMSSDIPDEPDISDTLAPAPKDSESMGAPLLPTEKLKKIKIFHDENETTDVPEDKTAPHADPDKRKVSGDEVPEQSEATDNPDEVKIIEEPEVVAETEPEELPENTTEEDSTAVKPTDELKLDDPDTGKLVDAIVAEEADELLAAEDERAGNTSETPPLLAAQPKTQSKFKAFFGAWWHNRLYRRLTVILLLAGLVACAVLPSSRYFVLNTVGVRASTSMVVLDQTTGQPLKNVEVNLAGQTSRTDKEGTVRLDHIKLGAQTLSIKKVAFADMTKELNIGWGSNPLGSMNLIPVGSQYTFILSDFLSGKSLTKGEASSGEASASSNEKGEVVLSVPQSDDAEIEVTITADNYRNEILKIPAANKVNQQVKLVPARKAVFVSKRSGTFDIYKIDVDGKNEQKLLLGTGSEQPDSMTLVSHPAKEMTAFVSTRGNIRNKDGFLLSTLNIINVENATITKIGQSERIQIIDWIGDRLIYVVVAEGASAASPQRHRLMSYDLKTEQEKELASTNYFNDVMVARGAIYYSPAIYKVNGAIGLFRIDSDGSGKKTISDKEAWNLFRTSFDRISVSVGQDWYDYDIPGGKFSKATGAPPALVSRLYIGSPDDSRSLWVEDRDGKGTLLAYDHTGKEDKVLHSQSGLKNPLRWLDNDHVVYRVAGGPETADYVMSLSGGQPKKLTDVTNTAGTDRWYYY